MMSLSKHARWVLSSLIVSAALLGIACTSDQDNPDAPKPDASTGGTGGVGGSGGDGGVSGAAGTGASAGTAGQPEAGPDAPPDSAPDTTPDSPAEDVAVDVDAGLVVPLDGMGEISGQCGVLDDAEWNASLPFLFRNAIDFGTAGFVEADLSPGGAEILADGNLNPGSIHSEIVAYEALYRCELATYLKSEGEVDYKDAGGKKTDVLVEIDGLKVGVSVVRAFRFPPGTPYTVADATIVLHDKLSEIPLSAANAQPQDAWVRSILHVVAYDAASADSIETAWEQTDDTLRGDTIVVVTVTDGEDAFVY